METGEEILNRRSISPFLGAAFAVFLTLFIIYPLFHELGHALAAWMFGGKVMRITIYPAFYTECFIRPDQIGCYIITAIAGILFPLICSFALRMCNEKGFLVAFCLRVMSVGYAIGELVCVSKCILGRTTETSDLSILIYETKLDPYVSLVLAGFLLILSLILLVSMEPMHHFEQIIAHHSSCYGHFSANDKARREAG